MMKNKKFLPKKFRRRLSYYQKYLKSKEKTKRKTTKRARRTQSYWTKVYLISAAKDVSVREARKLLGKINKECKKRGIPWDRHEMWDELDFGYAANMTLLLKYMNKDDWKRVPKELGLTEEEFIKKLEERKLEISFEDEFCSIVIVDYENETGTSIEVPDCELEAEDAAIWWDLELDESP